MSEFVPLSAAVERKLTLTELGVIVSLLLSIGGLIFTGGVVYGQVQRNTADIKEIKPQVVDMREKIARIDANVQFLTEQARRDD